MTFPRMRTSIRTLTGYISGLRIWWMREISMTRRTFLPTRLDTDSLDCLEMALTFYMYPNQLKDEEL